MPLNDEILGTNADGIKNHDYGIACSEEYISVSEYGKDGSDAKLIILKRRNAK